MKYVARTLLPILLSLGIHGDLVEASAAASDVPVAPEQEATVLMAEEEQPAPLTNSVRGGTVRQRELVAWALGRFEAANLELPVLLILLHSDSAECDGNRGFFSSSSTPWMITFCTEDQMVYLHEIGHVWSEFNLSEPERSAYVERQGLESWNDADTDWGDRGSEDAANTLAWGLVEDPIAEMSPDGPLAQRNESFRFLTGSDSPRVGG